MSIDNKLITVNDAEEERFKTLVDPLNDMSSHPYTTNMQPYYPDELDGRKQYQIASPNPMARRFFRKLMNLQTVGFVVAMSKVLKERNRFFGVSIARGMLRGPVTEGCPVSALPLLAISGGVESPRIQECISSRALDILSEVVEAMRGMTGWISQRLTSG